MEENKQPVAIHIGNYDGKEPIKVEIINREGDAAVIIHPKKVDIVGNIYAVREYITKKLLGVTELQAGHISISNLNKIDALPSILLQTDPAWSDAGYDITSQLVMSKDFTDFNFNKEDAGKSTKQMISFLRSHAHCFASIEEVRTLIKKLQNQEVKFEQLASQQDDRKGAVETSIKEQIKITKGELPDSVTITVPFFEGTPLQTISAEIEIDRKGTMPVFSFYCLGVEAAVMKFADDLVREQLTEAASLFTIYYK